MRFSVSQPSSPEASSPEASSQLAADLARWTARGLLSSDQAAAILAHEAARRPGPTAPAPQAAARPSRVPVVAEALGYLGGMLAVVGLVLVVARYWPDMAVAGRLALSGVGALVLLGAGALVHADDDAALGRLRAFVWLASTAATALWAGVLAADALGAESGETVALACSAAVALQSGVLWRWCKQPVQQLTTLGGLAVLAGTAVAQVAAEGPVGLAVWAIGATYLFLGLRRRTTEPLLTVAVGAVTVVVGAVLTATGWEGSGLVFAVATAFGLLAVSTVEGLAHTRAEQLAVGIVGGIALLQTAPGALDYFARDAGVATGLTTWVIGSALLFVGSRGRVRLAHVATAFGAAALIGGAALTGVQWQAFAPLFGIVTAIGLVGLGMLPGQVLLSVFGSLGLLVNVPWAIGHFFPGEGRAPLLIMVSGVLILGAAVLLSRMGGRFRRELGLSRRRRPTSRALPGHP